jgi:hypothetical protein
MPKHANATYLYCVVTSARKPPAARAPEGVPAATRPAASQAAPSLWLITAEVPLDVYGPSALEPRLRDLDWVARVAVAHESVVEHFSNARGQVVVPAKLFTMFTTLDKAIEDVGSRRAALARVTRRIAGCEEWGVRVFRKQPIANTAAGAVRPTSGAAFLAARKAARDAVVDARVQAATVADAAYRRLSRQSRDAIQRERRQEPGTNPPVLDAAFLVPAAKRTAFKKEARVQREQCADAGLELALTGPWPAYNFIGNPS